MVKIAFAGKIASCFSCTPYIFHKQACICLSGHQVLAWEYESRRRKVKYPSSLSDSIPIPAAEIQEKRTRFSLSHDQESIGRQTILFLLLLLHSLWYCRSEGKNNKKNKQKLSLLLLFWFCMLGFRGLVVKAGSDFVYAAVLQQVLEYMYTLFPCHSRSCSHFQGLGLTHYIDLSS